MSFFTKSFMLLVIGFFCVLQSAAKIKTEAKVQRQEKLKQELIQLRRTINEAETKQDFAALDRLLAEDYIFTESSKLKGGNGMKRLFMARLAIVIAFALSVSLSVMAHHGWADFDRSKKVEISGVIVESKYENPHSFVRLKVEQGEWAVELSAVPRMKRNRITAEMIKPGTRVTLIGHPHKKKGHEMKATHMILNGKTYDLTL